MQVHERGRGSIRGAWGCVRVLGEVGGGSEANGESDGAGDLEDDRRQKSRRRTKVLTYARRKRRVRGERAGGGLDPRHVCKHLHTEQCGFRPPGPRLGLRLSRAMAEAMARAEVVARAEAMAGAEVVAGAGAMAGAVARGMSATTLARAGLLCSA